MNYLQELKNIYQDYRKFDKEKIPLCAAETYMSMFTKQGLMSAFEGKYIQGYKDRIIEKDNIGSNKIYPLLELVEKLCKELYNADYADCRTLSGMNCMAILIMALIDKESTVIISTKEMGGHPSLANILDNLGIRYIPMPYDFSSYQISYERLNQLLKQEKNISYVIFCQSDILVPPNIARIQLQENQGIIYDASQTLGLIAGDMLANPIDYCKNLLLIGGTHKTLPGPTCGLIMTNNSLYRQKIDYIISPTLLRNIQPNNIAALCLALIEQKECGKKYQQMIVENANVLGQMLENLGITVVKPSNSFYTKTHQLFLQFDEQTTNRLYKNALYYNVTLNKRVSRLYTGIRLGTQEITRYGYTKEMLGDVAELIFLLSQATINDSAIQDICKFLASHKKPLYVLDDIFMV